MATKTFPYSVIWNGEIVPANTPIEVNDEKPKETAVKKDANKRTGRKA